jgi:hypothetical protein
MGLIISCSVLIKMRNVLKCRENRNTHFMLNNFFFRKSCHYEITWEKVLDSDRPQMTILRMNVACCILKPTNILSEYVIFIAFPWQLWLHQRTSLFHYKYIFCFVKLKKKSLLPALCKHICC